MLDYSIDEIKDITNKIKESLENKKEFYWQEDMQYLLDVIDKYVLNDENDFYGVKIYNPITKKYMCKGMGWNDTGKVWNKLGYAKTALYIYYYYPEKFIENNIEYLQSYFIVNIKNKGIMKIPVYDYYIDYLSRQRSDKAKAILELLKEKKQEILKNLLTNI